MKKGIKMLKARDLDGYYVSEYLAKKIGVSKEKVAYWGRTGKIKQVKAIVAGRNLTLYLESEVLDFFNNHYKTKII